MKSARIILVALVTLALSACGNEALHANANVANAMLEVKIQSSPLVRQLRRDAAVSAARAVHDSGGTEEQAQAAAAEAAQRWLCAIDTHRVYGDAVGAYIDSIALAQASGNFDLNSAIGYARAGVSSYRSMRSCLVSLGNFTLPELPDFFNLIPPSWNVQ
jgi:hypothetical protein